MTEVVERKYPSYPHVESITEFADRGLKIRIWRSEAEVADDYDREDLGRVARAHRYDAPSVIAHALAALPRVTAVEVKNGLGNGVVIYVEWP